MKKITLKLLFAFVILTFITNCSKDDRDDNINPATASEVNDFVWKAMNLWYFWQQDVSDLADDRFTSNEDYANYLNSFSSPYDLFDALKFNEDRFSWIVDDYIALLNSFQGVSKTNGVEFGVFTIGGTEVFGIVQYILPNSDASTKNIKRGDVFTSVDGIDLNLDNYWDILFKGSDSYTLKMAEISGGSIVSTGIDVALTKLEYTENPVFIAKTLDVNGIKIGYLMYNRFTSNFDEQLNNAFGDFKANGISDLVVDLRYNPGGRVSTAIRLSSMITGQFTGDLFLRAQFNDKLQAQFTDEALNSYFVDKLSDGSLLNSLNLNKVYVLAQNSSASASELLINSLNPYIDVIHIGGNTRGKNEFSTTLFDIPDCSFIDSNSCEFEPNPNHLWALQPLIGRNANAAGFLDYADTGLIPDIVFPEDLENYGVLGDVNEPLLARAIQHLSGFGKAFTNSKIQQFEAITNSNIHTPMRDNMYIDTEITNILIKQLKQNQ